MYYHLIDFKNLSINFIPKNNIEFIIINFSINNSGWKNVKYVMMYTKL